MRMSCRVLTACVIQAVLALSCSLAMTTSSFGKTGRDVVIGREGALDSKILGERRHYRVYVPAQYDDPLYAPVRHPVLYLLDGDWHFHSASGVVHFMSEATTQIPRLIVVAIANTDRTRDMTPTASRVDDRGQEQAWVATSGGADRFLAFMEKELIPRIEADYRAAPHRTLVGHSLGGLVALHSFLSQPGLFQGYIALDPALWWQEQLMVTRLQEKLRDVPDSRTTVYMALAHHRTTGERDETTSLVSTLRFAEILQSRRFDRLKVTLRQFAEEDHSTIPLPGLYAGLLDVFAGYKLDYDFPHARTVGPLRAHFEAASARLGVPLLPPEPLVDQLGRAAYSHFGDLQLAREYLQLNVENYPTSAHARASLRDLPQD
jgi:uncharacterized protein